MSNLPQQIPVLDQGILLKTQILSIRKSWKALSDDDKLQAWFYAKPNFWRGNFRQSLQPAQIFDFDRD